MNPRRKAAVFLVLHLAFVLLVSSGLQSTAWGTVYVYNSFGPGNTYNSGIDWAVSGNSTSSGYRGQAEFFVPSVSGYLSSIQLATYHVSGSTFSDFFIAQDNGSGVPGSIMETWMNVQNVNGLLTINSGVQPLLQAGQEYWICDEPAAADSDNGWFENSQNVANGFAFERSEWGWGAITSPAPPSGVFSVSVTPVPEPSPAALILLSVVLLARRCRSPVATNGFVSQPIR